MTPEQEQTIRKLHAEGINREEIAHTIGISYSKLRAWIGTLELPSNQLARQMSTGHTKINDENRAMIFKLYSEGGTVRSVASAVGLSRTLVHKILLTENRILTPIRPKKEKSKSIGKNAKTVTTKQTKYTQLAYSSETVGFISNAASKGVYQGLELKYRN